MQWYDCGYLVMTRIQRPSDLDPLLFPETMYALRDCSFNALPEHWWRYFSADPSNLLAKELADWYTKNEAGLLLPNLFTTIELAQEFAQKLSNWPEELQIVRIGLAAAYHEQFMAEQTAKRPSEQPEGFLTMLQQPKQLPIQQGQWLGVELGWFNYSSIHSWVCESEHQRLIQHDAPVDCRPNQFGLLKSLAAAEYLIPQISIYNGINDDTPAPNVYPFCLIAYEPSLMNTKLHMPNLATSNN
ncbi:MAG TPA: hypothetical protein DEF47_13870 [Herpetosiphon sp.]|uniref:Uncharacterized protein n=2 Tax=Herpetosiphon TaxID=64 RepID=A9AZN2_HERA2|nr:hypothetical protein Haur_4454 [Herpetosiphon aurantiacus DSM 785]HBW50976.1 hypothetical protein [Herpetosiphon sp.]